jgi:asparagine synthase (glutamine-hydrolysing)
LCGFVFYKNFNAPLDEYSIRKMHSASQRLVKRGPDTFSSYIEKNYLIYFYRLSIMDLTDVANQPMIGEQQILAFNGMIYNHGELRSLLSKYTSFKSCGDTEVLLQAIQHWGLNALDKIDGMFAALAINKNTDEIVFFRDHYGQKPLYYYHDKGHLIVSSELSVIRDFIGKHIEIDEFAINQFLSLSYIPGNSSLYKGISKVLPGEVISVNKDGDIHKKIYFDIADEGHKEPFSLPKLDAKLMEACNYVSDAHTGKGLLLSGGVDSSLVCHYLSKGGPLDCFFLEVDDSSLNELSKVEILQKKYGFKLNVKKLGRTNFEENIIPMLKLMDEPHGDPGYFNSYYLTKNLSKDKKVLITGDGADELFCGYETFKALSIPSFLESKFFIRIMEAVFKEHKNSYMSMNFKLNQFKKGLENTGIKKGLSWTSNNMRSSLAKNYIYDSNFISEIQNKYCDLDKISQLKRFYTKIFLPEFICAHTDRSLMMNSIEGRSPFLNKKFGLYSNSIPNSNNYSFGNTKISLKNLSKFVGLPEQIYNSKKIGFTMPLAKWFREKSTIADEILNQPSLMINSYLDKKDIQMIMNNHKLGLENNYREIYNLMLLEIYLNG